MITAVARRALLGLGLVSAGCPGYHDDRRPPSLRPPPSAMSFLVVELRPHADPSSDEPTRAALRRSLEEAFAPGDPAPRIDRMELLGRELDDRAAGELLAEARAAHRRGDCARARTSAALAGQLLLGRRAAGLDEPARLVEAWTAVVRCADALGPEHLPGPAYAALRLRELGAGDAIPPALAADAPAGSPVELTITVAGAAPGAAVLATRVDDRPIGSPPITVAIARGQHVIAVSAPGQRGTLLVTAGDQPLQAEVSLGPVLEPHEALVRRWQLAGGVEPAGLDRLLEDAGVELAIVITADDVAALWQRHGGPAAAVVTGPVATMGPAAARAWAVARRDSDGERQ